MLREKYLPVFDVSKTESILVDAPLEKVFPIVADVNFQNSKIIYWLFKLRGIPVPGSLSLKGLEKINFQRLETIPNQEIIIGLIGQFWTPTGRLQKFKAEEFLSFNNEDFAKATWSFTTESLSPVTTLISTETCVYCPSQRVKKQFKFYWSLIAPFSTWTRREILKSMKRQAERKP